MNEIISKSFEGSSIRIVADEYGDPWFVAADIATVLGYSEASAMTRCLDEDERGLSTVQTLGGMQDLITINESGLYSAILRSRKPEAKFFRRWVTSEVLPSIRKNGGYIAGQEHDSPELIMAKALMVAQSVIDRKSRELEQAKRIIEEQEPAVEFSAHVGKNDKGVLLELFGKSVGIGRNTLFCFLRDNKILISSGKSKNIPYQEYINRGYFTTSESYYEHHGDVRLSFTTLITGKGQQWLVGRLIEGGYLVPKAEAKKMMEVV